MPDTPELQKHFGQSGQQAAGCGLPTAHRLALVHVGSGLIQKGYTSALRPHDLSGVTIETGFGHPRTTMKRDVLRRETVRGAMKELTMFLLVYNLVRMTMLEAARQQGVPVDRIGFVDAMRWLATAEPGDPLKELVVNPLRPNRIEPRVRKRRPKEYPLLKKPRAVLRQQLATEGVAA